MRVHEIATFVFGVLCTVLLVMVYAIFQPIDSGNIDDPTMPAIHRDLATPLAVHVDVLLRFPTPTDYPTSHPSPTEAHTPVPLPCGGYLNAGDICQIPNPTPPPTATLATCAEVMATPHNDGRLCRW